MSLAPQGDILYLSMDQYTKNCWFLKQITNTYIVSDIYIYELIQHFWQPQKVGTIISILQIR